MNKPRGRPLARGNRWDGEAQGRNGSKPPGQNLLEEYREHVVRNASPWRCREIELRCGCVWSGSARRAETLASR